MKAVIFDVGGVLYHNDKTTEQHVFESEFGLQSGELAQIVFDSPVAHRASIGQATRLEMWHEAQQELGISDADLSRVQAALLPTDTWDDVLIAFAKSLRSRCKTAVLSDAWEGSREAIAATINEEGFDTLVYSYEVGVQKPDPLMYETVLAKLEIEAAQAMFIDDTYKNVVGAQALGIHAVQYKSRDQVITAVLDWLH